MTLTLLDLSLAASLVLMMIFSGYENFVSKIEPAAASARMDGHAGFRWAEAQADLVIVAISGVDLLKSFMNIGDGNMPGQARHLHTGYCGRSYLKAAQMIETAVRLNPPAVPAASASPAAGRRRA